MEVKVLGTGCQKCDTLMQRLGEVIMENRIFATVQKVQDMEQIMSYDVMNTPALVVDGKVVVKGRVPTKNELLELLKDGIVSTPEDDHSSCCCGSHDCC